METEHERFNRILPRWYSEGTLMPTDSLEYFDWVKQQNFDVWHSIIFAATDADEAVVSQWIVSQPECDLGTAVTLFRMDAGNLDYKLSDLDRHYYNQWHAIKTCETRLFENNFKTKDLIPSVLYNGLGLPSGKKQFKVPEQVKTFEGKRKAVSDYTVSGGSLMLTLGAFCKSIGEPPLEV